MLDLERSHGYQTSLSCHPTQKGIKGEDLIRRSKAETRVSHENRGFDSLPDFEQQCAYVAPIGNVRSFYL